MKGRRSMKKINRLWLLLAVMISAIFILAGCCELNLTEHKYGAPEVRDPTCVSSGYTVRYCEVCSYDDVYDFTDPLGHSTEITKKGIAPTCTEGGMTDETVCRVCDMVIKKQEELPPNGHSITVTKEMVDATCTANGVTEEQYCSSCEKILHPQTVIMAYGHGDGDENGLCDRCGIPYGDKVIYVSTPEQLQAINNNLGGVYKLTADISLANFNWTPIGSADKPFTGHLFGDGHSISNLTMNNFTVGGIFSHTSGTIDGVVVENFRFHTQDVNATSGCIAAHNNGTIRNCHVGGINVLTHTVYYAKTTSYPRYDGGSVSYKGIHGGLTGINNGVIRDCTADGNYECWFENTAKYTLKHSILFYLPGGDELKSTLTFYFGIIAGQNKNQISNCDAKTSLNNIISVEAVKVKKYGLAIAESYGHIGSIVGYNDGKIADSTGKAYQVQKNVGETKLIPTTASEYGEKCVLKLYEDQTYPGVVGTNKGKVENTLCY